MKKSNLFILSCALLILGFFVGANLLPDKYVTVPEFKNNQRESIKSLDTETYNYRTVHFDEPFDEVVIRDTSGNRPERPKTGNANTIQWVRSAQSGLKRVYYGDYNMKVEDNKLIIYISPSTNYWNKMILYSPSLSKIKVENSNSLVLADTKNDSLEIESDFNVMEIAASTYLKKLTIQSRDQSHITVKVKSIDNAAYFLSSNSSVRSQIDSCNGLSIQGDSTSTVIISSGLEDRGSDRSIYNYMTYNDNIGSVIIESATVNKIRGDKEKLTLNMTVKQIEETLRNVSTN